MTTTAPQLAWTQLLRTALLGTRQSTEPITNILGEGQAGEAADQREKSALLAAGALALVHKAGFRPAAATASAATLAPPETQPTLSTNGTAHLRLLLGGAHSELLPDYLLRMAQAGARVPHALLVPLLDYSRTRLELHRLLGPVLGQRGQWLAAQNPEWQSLLAGAPEAPDEAIWETGTLRQRTIYLEALRQRNPDRARELLAASLPAEPAKNQAQLLATLNLDLSAADEALLTQYLASKSKEVRQTVLPLLVRLPGSAVAERLWQRAQPLLTLQGGLLGKKLIVTLPEAWDKTWQADGIEQKDGRFQGEKAAWLGQVLAVLPPARWAAHWQASPTKLLSLASATDWATVLLLAWREALLLHHDAAWAKAYLMLQLTDNKVPPLSGEQAASLLPPEQLLAVLLPQLPSQPRFSNTEAPWETLLYGMPGPWPEKLTARMLLAIGNTLRAAGGAHHYLVHYRVTRLLQLMQTTVPPAQHGLCETALAPLRPLDPALAASFDQLLATLAYRQQLTESLATLQHRPHA